MMIRPRIINHPIYAIHLFNKSVYNIESPGRPWSFDLICTHSPVRSEGNRYSISIISRPITSIKNFVAIDLVSATLSGRPGRAGRPNNSSSSSSIIVIISSSAMMVVVGPLPRLLANSFVVDHRRVAALDDVNVVVGVGGANAVDVVERMKKATMHDGTNVIGCSVRLSFSAPRATTRYIPRR